MRVLHRLMLIVPLSLLAATAAPAQNAPAPAPQAPAPAQAAAPGAPAAAPGGQDQGLVVDVVGGISAPMPIAIPPMPSPAAVATAAGQTDALGHQVADVVANDLRGSGLFNPLAADKLLPVSYAQVTAPAFDSWVSTGAQALVQGFVRADGNGSIMVGCYLYDVSTRAELTRQGFVVAPSDWRRAAHKCADAIYTRLTGEGPYFDSRVVYISETGPKNHKIKRLAIMDQDGANHRFLTNGQAIVLTPHLSPDEKHIVYMSYQNDRPALYVYDLGKAQQRLLVSNANLTFAPRISPDGKWVVFTMSVAGNADVYRVSINGGAPQRLTTAPGIDTGGSYSPDGSQIVFESDRSGTQQLYVMNADGSNQHRISFGAGRYATPSWSPRGDLIAFTRIGGGAFRVGVMSPSGGGEHLLTDSWGDEGPSWSPNGRVLMFFRAREGAGRTDVWSVDLTGVNARAIPTPLDGSDPSWGPLRQ